MRELLLGIDIGTSACKAAVFGRDGEVVAQTAEEYPVSYPKPGWAEQDPELWWQAVCAALRRLTDEGRFSADEIAGVGVDGQSWSAIAVDRAGRVLCPTPIWMDTRAQGICDSLRGRYGEERFFSVSGNPLSPSYTMPKVLWYKEQLPGVYAETDKILQSNSFIAFRLTGEISQDVSQGYGWACFDMARGAWDEALCREAGLRPELLPPLAACSEVVGRVTAAAARQTGLREGTPVVAGGLDAACGTLGAGVIRPGETQEQGGQAGGMSICMDVCRADRRLILGAHVVPGLWLLQGGTVGGGGAMNWFEREFGAAERRLAETSGLSSFAEIDREAVQLPPGSEGLVFLPYLAGERSPIWDVHAKGVWYGVTFSKTRAHFARACMEGVAYSLRHNLEAAREAGASAGVLRAMGGSANSRLWTQMKADVTGCRIEVPGSDTATSLGAAILAGVGAGVYEDFEEAVRSTVRIRRTHEPDAAAHEAYEKGYRTYLRLYESLKDLMKEDAQ